MSAFSSKNVSSFVRRLPSVSVFVCLGLVGVWGHRTGWKAPRFSELFGAAAEAKEDWCSLHNVPDSKCLSCHPELVGESAEDWCKEHGVPESRCTICHPEILAQGVAEDWCAEHGVPESSCTLCHPEIAVLGEPPSGDVRVTAVSDAAGRDPQTCQTHVSRVQFASAESVRKAGIALGAVVERMMPHTITVNAEVDYDRTRLAQISSRAAGTAWRVEKEVGEVVRAGEVLALIDAAEVGRAKAEYLSAGARVELREKALRRRRALQEDKIVSQAAFEETQAALREAQIRLFNARQALINLGLPIRSDEEPIGEPAMQFLGLPTQAAEALDPAATTANLLPLTAPFDGAVVARQVVAGEAVDPARPLFTVADVRRMWIMMDARQEDAGRIAPGQSAVFRADGSPDDAVVGRITWVSTAVDEETRTVKVRAEVENPDGRLRAHVFGRAIIMVRASGTAAAVPNEALQWDGCCYVVFVRVMDEIFQTRKVRLGARHGGYTEVVVGVSPGEVVATTGSHVLKSEILKSNLGAGCAGE